MDDIFPYIPRILETPLKLALSDTRVVAIQGARQTGKSTLARHLIKGREARYLTLDTASVRESAQASPADFVRQMPGGLLVIDEIQRVPQLLLEIKEVADVSNKPGQFLITGSSNLSMLSGIQESLAGRLERYELMPFCQQELEGTSANALFDFAFYGTELPRIDEPVQTRSDYLMLAQKGGYPEVLSRSSIQRRNAWFDNYLKLLFEQESSRSKYGSTPEQLSSFIRYLASISGKEAVIDNISRDMALSRYGVEQLIAYFERLFLVETLPSWSTNLTTRATKHRKVFLKDSGLTARLMRASAQTPTDLTSPIAGAIFETFVFNELYRMAQARETELKFYHYRDTRQREVDIVIENDEGRILLIEAKASSTVTKSDFTSLRYLIDKHPERIACGLVVYTGGDILSFGERLFALPTQYLWG